VKTIRRLKITLWVTVLYALTQLSSLGPELPWHLHWIISGLVIAIAGYIEWIKGAPVLRLQNRRRILFDRACEPAMERLRKHDSTARLNIMEVDGFSVRWFRFLRIIYDLHVDKGDADTRMRLLPT
jgi:hypothetical protein